MLENLRRDLSVFNSFDLLGKVGALHLLPENANRRISLDALAHLLAAQDQNEDAPSISRHRLDSLLRRHLAEDSDPGIADDPPHDMFTDEITFPNGPYVVFPGTIDGASDILRWLLRAGLRVNDGSGRVESFWEDVICASILCLSASDAIARRTGLERGTPPTFKDERGIMVPTASAMARGVRAVTFTQSELNSLTGDGIDFEPTIASLTVDLGEVDWDLYQFEHGALHYRPFVVADDKYIVPIPSSLLSGLIHRILCIADEYGILAEISQLYRQTVCSDIEEQLRYSGSHPVSVPLPKPEPSAFAEGLFSLDTDKIIYVQVVTDDRIDFVGDYEPSQWNTGQLQKALEQRAKDVVTHLSDSGTGSDRVLILTITESTGRMFLMTFGEPPHDSVRLVLSACSFKYMSLLDAGDPLWLWKYARASRRLHNQAQVFCLDVLDEYSTYRTRRSFYLSDQDRPESIIFAPNSGFDIKQSVSEELDPHGIPAYEPGYLVQVQAAFGKDIPIFFAPSLIHLQPALLVEGALPMPVWVVGQEKLDPTLKWVQKDLVEMVAYWLWQFESLLGPSLIELKDHVSILRVDLLLEDPENWIDVFESGEITDSRSNLAPYNFGTIPDGIQIHFHPAFLTRINEADNRGERELVHELLLHIYHFIQGAHSLPSNSMNSEMLESALETIAPLGRKKKMVLMTGNPVFFEDHGELPLPRAVQEADIDEILDCLGEHLVVKFGSEQNPSTQQIRGAIVNEAVRYLYGELQILVSTLDGADLLNQLLAYSESNIKENFSLDITMPTRVACFGHSDELVTGIYQDMQRSDTASLANRFLIEYVAAQPPSGNLRLSLERYDKLLALASEIYSLGTLSELNHFGLTDLEVTILPSRRLGFDHSAFESARNSFSAKLMVERVAHSEFEFSSHWESKLEEEDTNDKVPDVIKALDNAFELEFGSSLTHLVDLLTQVYNVGISQPGSVKKSSKSQLIASLARSLNWTREEVSTALDLLTIEPRKDFFRPPDNVRQEVYPWRFNRSWSCLRRPLLANGNETGSSILWGNRHLALAIQYLSNLAVTGRLKAATRPLKRILGDIREKKSKEFENSVGNAVSELTGTTTKIRLRKVGRKKIMAEGRDLGDIDVLGVIPSARTILCIECKALALARTPSEIRNQLEELFIGARGKPSTTQKHLKRVEWVEDNLDIVLQECFGLRQKGNWRVKPILVSDSELFASYLSESPFPVLSIESLKGMTVRDLSSSV